MSKEQVESKEVTVTHKTGEKVSVENPFPIKTHYEVSYEMESSFIPAVRIEPRMGHQGVSKVFLLLTGPKSEVVLFHKTQGDQKNPEKYTNKKAPFVVDAVRIKEDRLVFEFQSDQGLEHQGTVTTVLKFSGKKKKPLEIPLLVGDRKSTRLNSSHTVISYAVF